MRKSFYFKSLSLFLAQMMLISTVSWAAPVASKTTLRLQQQTASNEGVQRYKTAYLAAFAQTLEASYADIEITDYISSKKRAYRVLDEQCEEGISNFHYKERLTQDEARQAIDNNEAVIMMVKWGRGDVEPNLVFFDPRHKKRAESDTIYIRGFTLLDAKIISQQGVSVSNVALDRETLESYYHRVVTGMNETRKNIIDQGVNTVRRLIEAQDPDQFKAELEGDMPYPAVVALLMLEQRGQAVLASNAFNRRTFLKIAALSGVVGVGWLIKEYAKSISEQDRQAVDTAITKVEETFRTLTDRANLHNREANEKPAMDAANVLLNMTGDQKRYLGRLIVVKLTERANKTHELQNVQLDFLDYLLIACALHSKDDARWHDYFDRLEDVIALGLDELTHSEIEKIGSTIKAGDGNNFGKGKRALVRGFLNYVALIEPKDSLMDQYRYESVTIFDDITRAAVSRFFPKWFSYEGTVHDIAKEVVYFLGDRQIDENIKHSFMLFVVPPIMRAADPDPAQWGSFSYSIINNMLLDLSNGKHGAQGFIRETTEYQHDQFQSALPAGATVRTSSNVDVNVSEAVASNTQGSPNITRRMFMKRTAGGLAALSFPALLAQCSRDFSDNIKETVQDLINELNRDFTAFLNDPTNKDKEIKARNSAEYLLTLNNVELRQCLSIEILKSLDARAQRTNTLSSINKDFVDHLLMAYGLFYEDSVSADKDAAGNMKVINPFLNAFNTLVVEGLEVASQRDLSDSKKWDLDEGKARLARGLINYNLAAMKALEELYVAVDLHDDPAYYSKTRAMNLGFNATTQVILQKLDLPLFNGSAAIGSELTLTGIFDEYLKNALLNQDLKLLFMEYMIDPRFYGTRQQLDRWLGAGSYQTLSMTLVFIAENGDYDGRRKIREKAKAIHQRWQQLASGATIEKPAVAEPVTQLASGTTLTRQELYAGLTDAQKTWVDGVPNASTSMTIEHALVPSKAAYDLAIDLFHMGWISNVGEYMTRAGSSYDFSLLTQSDEAVHVVGFTADYAQMQPKRFMNDVENLGENTKALVVATSDFQKQLIVTCPRYVDLIKARKMVVLVLNENKDRDAYSQWQGLVGNEVSFDFNASMIPLDITLNKELMDALAAAN